MSPTITDGCYNGVLDLEEGLVGLDLEHVPGLGVTGHSLQLVLQDPVPYAQGQYLYPCIPRLASLRHTLGSHSNIMLKHIDFHKIKKKCILKFTVISGSTQLYQNNIFKRTPFKGLWIHALVLMGSIYTKTSYTFLSSWYNPKSCVTCLLLTLFETCIKQICSKMWVHKQTSAFLSSYTNPSTTKRDHALLVYARISQRVITNKHALNANLIHPR